MKNQRVHLAAYLSTGLVLALFALAALSRSRLLWGFNAGAFLPIWVAWAALMVGILLMWRYPALKLQDWLDTLSAMISDSRRLRLIVPALLGLGFLVLFQTFQSSSSLLGDAILRLNQIDDGRLLLLTEMGDFLVHAVLSRLYFIPNEIDIERCYNIVSVVSGLFFVFGAWRLAAYLKPQQSIQWFMVLISSGMTVLFFGYIESYSLLAALIPFVILQALKVVDGSSSRWKFLALYIVAGLVHSVAIFLFLGVLLVIFLRVRSTDPANMKTVNRALSILFATILCLGYLGRSIGWFGLERQLLGLTGREGYELALFTANHAWNLINWVLLAGLPIVLFLPLALAQMKKSGKDPKPRSLLAIWLAVPSVMFVLFFTPQLGGARDWDLFSLPIFLILTALIIGYLSRPERRIPTQVLPLLVVGALSTFAFGYVNSSPALSAERFEQILKTTKFKNQIQEYIGLMDHAREYPELSDRRLEYALQAWGQPPYKQTDSSYVLNYLHWMTGYRSRNGHVPINVPSKLKSDINNRDRILLLACYHLRFGNEADLMETAGLLAQGFQTDVKARLYAGLLYLKLNELDACGLMLWKAYLLDSNDVEVLTASAAYQYQVGELQSAIDLLNRAVKLNPRSFQAHHSLAVALNDIGQVDLAVEQLAKAKELATSQTHRRMFEKIWREVSKAIQNNRSQTKTGRRQ